MAEGRNLLEVVLNTDIAKKFNEVDNSVSKLQSTLDTATSSANRLAEALKNAASSFGDASGTNSFIENIQKLIETLNGLSANAGAKSIEQTKKGIESIGEAAILDIDSVQKLIDAINKIPEAFSKTSGGTSGRSGGSKKKALDNLLFSRDDIEEKKRELESELERLSSAMMKIKSRINEVSKPKIDEMKFGIEAQANKEIEAIRVKMQQLWQDMSVAMQKSGENSKDALVPYLQTVEKLRGEISEIQKNAATMKDMVSARDVTDKSVIELLKQYDAVLAKIHQVAEERRNLIQEQNSTAAQSKQDAEYKKRIDGIISSIKDLQKQYDELKKKNKVFDNEGNMTLEAERIANQISAQKELLKIEQMSAEEAVKYTENKVNAQIKNEQEAFSEIKRLYSEMLGYEKKQAEIEIKGTSKEIQGKDFGEETKLAEIYQKEIDRTRKSIDELAAKYPELAEEAKKAYDTERIKAQIASSEKLDNAIDKTIKSTEALAEAERKRKEAERDKKIGLAGGDAPRTIREYEIAINNLRREIKNLDADTKRGQIKEYNKRIAEYKKKVDAAIGSTNRFRQENMKLNDVLQRVAGAFGIYIGLQSIANFARNVAQVTGEFEMQHRAMQAIIGDMDAANKLWDKTIALAVKSPYRVKDLVSYTKQLAAYRVETDKLYDTTKMLADISSGLGVDMQRLILAYGQVKAANYLRGQELRQFSEAGINILGELSKYFEEIKGQAVSTAEVFDMVSKRMVKFEDVAEVLKRLTEEGGIFFNMQEIQSETLRGKMMNLKDSFDIMMNSIGEKNKGVIIGFVDSIKKMVENWEDVATILKIVVGLFVTFKIAQISAGVSLVRNKVAADAAALGISGLSARLINLIAAEEGATAATLNLSTALKTLNSSKGGWIGVAVSFLLTIAVAVYDYYRRSTELQKELNQIQIESAASTRKMTNQYNELASKIRDANTSESERAELMAKMKRLYGEILPDRLMNIDYIKKEGNAYTEATEAIKNYYQSLRREKEIQATEERYGKSVADSQQMLAKSIQHEIEQNHKRKVGMDDINAVLEEFKNRVDAGTASAENMNEVLKELIDNQTGIKLDEFDFENFVMEPGSGRTITGISRYLSSFYSDYAEYNDKMQELTGRTTEYLQTLKEGIENNVFKIGDQNLDKQIEDMIANGEIGDDLKSKMEEKGKRAAKAYRQAFNIYLNTDEYQNLEESQKKEAVNLFEKMFDAKVAEHQMSNAQKTIAGKIDDLNDEFRLKPGQKSILEELVIGKGEGVEEYLKRAKPKVEGFLNRIRDIKNGVSEKGKDDADNLLGMEGALNAYDKFLDKLAGKDKTKKTGNPALELLNKQIEAIKNASKQYEEYQKLYDDTTAFDKTKKAVQDLFGQLGIGGLLNKQGIFDKMTIQDQLKTWLSGQMAKAGKDGRIAIEKYIRELELQASQADFKRIVEAFEKNMDEAFTDYDMFKELQKLGIGGDISESVFGVTTKSLDQLKRAFAIRKKMLLDQYDGKEAIEAVEKMEKKITEMENKERVERLKKYTEYLIKGRDEAVKIHLDQLTKMAELDELHYGEGRYTETQYSNIAEQIRKETEAALSKNEWEQFKGSDFYTTMFEDLTHVADSSLNIMLDKLKSLRNNLNELDPTQVKEIIQSIEKIENEGRNRSPLSFFIKDIQALTKWDRRGNENKLAWLTGTEKEKKQEKDRLAKLVAEAQAEYDKLSKNGIQGDENEAKQRLDMYELALKLVNKELEDIQKNIGIINNENNRGEKAWDNVWTGVQKGAEYFNQAAEAAGQVSTEIMGMMDGIDDASKQLAEDIADFAGNTALLVKDIAAIIGSEGSDISAWIDAIVRVFNMLKSGLSINEWDINAELEKNAKALEELEYTYDRVKRASDRAWDTTGISKSHREIMSIIQAEINAYNDMINAESARKNPDDSALEEYRRRRQELYDQMEDDAEDFYERVGGLGAGNYGDAAQGFVDAWFEAFNETGDGLSGLQDHFNEVIENLVKRQALQRLSKTLMSGLFEMIDNAAKNGVVTKSELDEINQFAEQQLPSWNKALKNFAQSLGFLGDQAEGELDGLQKGIQGVTEQTAEIIAAYMNAIRYYVVDSNTKLGQIISSLQDSSGTFNPMVAELQNIRQQAEDIRNLLFSWRETSGVPSMRVTIV